MARQYLNKASRARKGGGTSDHDYSRTCWFDDIVEALENGDDELVADLERLGKSQGFIEADSPTLNDDIRRAARGTVVDIETFRKRAHKGRDGG